MIPSKLHHGKAKRWMNCQTNFKYCWVGYIVQMLSQYWATVEDSEPTLSRHWVNVSREVPLCSGHSSMTTNAVKMWIERQIIYYQHKSLICQHATGCNAPGLAFPYKLRYIVGFGLVEMDISTNPKPTIHRNLYGFSQTDFLNRFS